jgi:1,4-alpha-glucan branching enzyme
MLGPHEVDGGYVITAYHPSACGMVVNVEGMQEPYEMERIHEMGVFAVYVEEKTYHRYTITQYFDDGNSYTSEDPYSFSSFITAEDCYMFGKGTHYQIYEKLGAHPMELNGVFGTYFAVWAPHAKRVSLVGDLNMWDGRVYPMRRREDMGIFEIFIPHIGMGEIYKYEIMTKDGRLILKSDPYGNAFQMRPDNASVVTDIREFAWTDAKWMKKRNGSDTYKQPMNIYEVHIGSWKRAGENETEFMNYRDVAHDLAEYCEYMGYTHVELIGISEHPFDGSWGYQVTGYFAPTSRFGDARDFMYFVNYMHEHGISVILDWVPAHFPKDGFALGRFDGEPLYEHPDTRLGEHPDWGTYIFNCGMKEVSNFLIGSALFWLDKFHVDGLRTDAVASMLYLDYGKQDGQWVANKYGGKENLEAVEFLKHLNSIVERRQPGAMVIAEESTAWPNVTSRPEDGGLGFAYKWNMGWMNDFIEYISKDPLFRKGVHNKLTFAMAYHHSERYILVLSHDEVVHGKCSMLNKQPGDMYMKFQGLRTSYGFMFGHPGKKLLFMGQDFGQLREWSEERSLDWYLLDDSMHRKLHNWVRALLHLEKDYKALYETDYTDGFQWINCDDNEKSIVTFMRKSPDGKKSLVFVCNFTPVVWDEGFRVGVPNGGKYKEILNSDAEEFGGSGEYMNGDLRATKTEWDNQPYSIPVKVPPMSCVIFEYTHKYEKTPEQLALETAKKAEKKKTATKRKSAKTATAKKTAKKSK